MLSPIVLFVYNRPAHTQRTLEALQANLYAIDSDLYIFADGPKKTATDSILKDIEDTRKIIRQKWRFKSIQIVESSFNKGLAESVIQGITEVVSIHKKVIVLEDDIVTSPVFLSFMNEALDYYMDYEGVAGISGFTYPGTGQNDKVHFLPIGCSWGWATWQRQWAITSFDAKKLTNEIERNKLVESFDFGYYPFFPMLKKQAENLINSWAIRFYASFFLQKKCFVYPPVSLVSNIGFDNTATHTSSKDGFFDQVSANEIAVKFRSPVFDEDTLKVENAFATQYKQKRINLTNQRQPLWRRIRKRLTKILHKMTNN